MPPRFSFFGPFSVVACLIFHTTSTLYMTKYPCAYFHQLQPRPTENAAFDFGAEPPFTLTDIRKAIPEKCFKKDTLRSMSYLARDVIVVAGLAAGALAVKSPLIWPAYWLAQGTMFWALFVVGHDCGHGSFSKSKRVNSVIGEPC